jgi:hypothetical protein
MFMAEVKFLSYTGLQTFLNKLKENFVLKSDYVTNYSTNSSYQTCNEYYNLIPLADIYV